MILDHATIAAAGICIDCQTVLLATWPLGIPLTPETITTALQLGVDFDEAKPLLSPEQLVIYEAATASAWAARDVTVMPAKLAHDALESIENLNAHEASWGAATAVYNQAAGDALLAGLIASTTPPAP